MTGMIEWGPKSKPKKILNAFNKTQKLSLDQNLIPKNSHPEFPSHKNFQKALNDISRKLETFVLNTPKNPYLDQATQKKTCQNFPTQKIPEIENFKPQKIVRSSLSLEIRTTPLRCSIAVLPPDRGVLMRRQNCPWLSSVKNSSLCFVFCLRRRCLQKKCLNALSVMSDMMTASGDRGY